MSESITIPQRKGKQPASLSSVSAYSASTPTSTSSGHDASSACLSTSASSSVNPSTPASSSDAAPGRRLAGREKGKAPAREQENGVVPGPHSPWGHERRTSLLSSSLSKSEHTVINIGDPDGPPRLITCVKASQGFDWNQDIFLPSYASDHDYSFELEHRQDPVEDIFITEEEAERMFPR